MTSFDSLWHDRYGPSSQPARAPEQAAALMAQMLSHRTVRAYLDTPVSESAIELMMAAAQSAATSSNLQTWSVVAVQDPQRKARLADCAGSQAHIREAPLLIGADLEWRRQAAPAAGGVMSSVLVGLAAVVVAGVALALWAGRRDARKRAQNRRAALPDRFTPPGAA